MRCATRGAVTLDMVSSNVREAYRAIPLPHHDHISLFLIPLYIPIRQIIAPESKEIRIWPDGSFEQLKDCFERTNFNNMT